MLSKEKGMKIFITGGTGFVGKTLTRKLTEKGHEVTILTRTVKRKSLAHSGVSYIEGDPVRGGSWQERVREHEAIINLAGASIFSRWTNEKKRELRESRILLGKRAPDREFYPNVWDIIGGHCLPGEEPDHTLVRELEEEINVTPAVFRKLGVLDEPDPGIHGEREYHVYVVTEWIGEQGPVTVGEEHSEIRWFPVNEALELDLAHPRYAELFEAL